MQPSALLPAIGLMAWAGLEAALLSPTGASPTELAQRCVFGVGISAPFALLTLLFVSALVHAWDRAPFAGIRTRAAQSLAAIATRAPWDVARVVAGALVAMTCVLTIAIALGRVLIGTIHTPSFAAVGVVAVTTALVGFGVALTPLTTRIVGPAIAVIEHAFARAERVLASSGPRMRSVARVAVALTIVTLLGSLLSWVVSSRAEVFDALPLELLWGPLAMFITVAIGGLAGGWPGGRALLTRWAPRCVLVTLAATFVLALLAPWGLEGARRDISQRRSTLRLALSALDRVTDFDRDGASAWFAGEDCAPFDGERGPYTIDQPNDGVDQNCSGTDLRYDPAWADVGRPRHDFRPSDASRPPNILLVTTDALSFHHTSMGGYERDVTPHLTELASDATLFEAAFATGSSTSNAFPALFTGGWAIDSPGLLGRQFRPPGTDREREATLAELLGRAGYETVAIVGSLEVSRRAWPEIFTGFSAVDESALELQPRTKHTGPHITARAVEALRSPRKRPLFLWVHYFDHHPIYRVPAGEVPFGDGETELDRYDTELRFADRSWGALFAAAASAWPPAESVVVFTSDHGEAFDHHHPAGHHDDSLRTEEVHVPLIVRTATQRGTRRGGLVSHLDIVPTLLELAGAPSPPKLRGESLTPVLLTGAEPEKTIVLGMLWQPIGGPIEAPALRARSIRTADRVLIDDRERRTLELFAWRSDPLEDVDRRPSEAETTEWMRHALDLLLGPNGETPR